MTGCTICAPLAARRSWTAVGDVEVIATELGSKERVGFFRDTLAPLARRIPLGVLFVRIVDGVDLNHPVEAAEGRVAFQLHPIG